MANLGTHDKKILHDFDELIKRGEKLSQKFTSEPLIVEMGLSSSRRPKKRTDPGKKYASEYRSFAQQCTKQLAVIWGDPASKSASTSPNTSVLSVSSVVSFPATKPANRH